MKILIISLVTIAGLYFYFTWKPAASGIAEDIRIKDGISYNGKKYHSKWSDTETIKGFVRRKDRHYDKNMPIITYNLVLATDEYSDDKLVKIQNRGGGNYHWSAPRQPKGTLVFYHTIPATPEAQEKLDDIAHKETVLLRAKISESSEIKGDDGGFVRLGHSNHKFILVEDVAREHP